MGVTTKSLRTLLDHIDAGELVLPEIQRDFVWSKKNVLLLFDSLYRGLPIGYMLVWKTKVAVTSKRFHGKRRGRAGHAFDTFYGYLLDGQQRLTAIRFVRDRLDKYDLRFSLWPEDEKNPDQDRFKFWTRWTENPWYIPVADILSEDVSIYQVVEKLKEMEDFNPEKDSDMVYASLSKLQALMDYEVGLIEYDDSDYRRATELFIRFNSTGKKLNRSDLAAAELALSVPNLIANGINKVTTKYYPNFIFTKPFLIQCLSAVHTSRMEFQRPRDIWDGTDEKKIKKSWKKTELGLGRTISFLTGTVKWDSSSWLPSVNSIIPLVYIFSKNPLSKDERELARKWLLLSNLYAIFSGAVHTKLNSILRGLEKETTVKRLWNLTRKELGKVKPDHFDTRRKSGTAMSLFISMIRNKGAKDWILPTPLSGSVIGHNAELQVHHFFPKALLQKNGYESAEINNFSNFTIISKETNLNISDQEPIEYIKSKKISQSVLNKQCIPFDKILWKVENYENFISERRKLLASQANSFLKN